MSNERCDRCAELEAENRRLKEQLERAKRMIEKMKRVLMWVIAQLRGLAGFANWVIHQANKILKKKSGVAPRIWGFAKGAKWVAERMLGALCGIIAQLQMFMATLDA